MNNRSAVSVSEKLNPDNLNYDLEEVAKLSFFELIHRFDIDQSLSDCREVKQGRLQYPALGGYSIDIGGQTGTEVEHEVEHEVENRKHELRGKLEMAGIQLHHPVHLLERIIAQVAWAIGDRKSLAKLLLRYARALN